jgi:hypothetical protein
MEKSKRSMQDMYTHRFRYNQNFRKLFSYYSNSRQQREEVLPMGTQ